MSNNRQERHLELIKNKDYDTLIKENEKLVYNFIKRYNIKNKEEYEDILQCGRLGLYKAALNFDTKYNNFCTFASRCILNEINMYFRLEKKCNPVNIMSIESAIYNNGKDDKEIKIIDTIEDKNAYNPEIISYIGFIFKNNKFSDRDKLIFSLYLKGEKQAEIAKRVNLTQAQVSRILIKIKNKLKDVLS